MSSNPTKIDLEEAFDEAWYLRNYADIAGAVASGGHESGWQHYSEHGREEGRQPFDPRLTGLIDRANDQLQGRVFAFDEFQVCGDMALLSGWIDDRADPLTELVLQPYFGPGRDLLPHLVRVRRDDVAQMLDAPANAHDYGFWIALDGLDPRLPPVGAQVGIVFASGRTTELHIDARLVGAATLRNRVLNAAASERNVPADPTGIGRQAGPIARALNRAALAAGTVSPPVLFGPPDAAPTLSVIVPVAGALDAVLRQAAFLAGAAGPGRAELIYVHIGAGAVAEFERAVEAVHELYGIAAQAVRCTGEPGLARARNAGAAAARGAALLFLAPDAFPAGADWLDRALALAHDKKVSGATLLDEDDAVAACGLRWRLEDRRSGIWCAGPDLAGLPAAALAGRGATPTDAVGADAMVVSRALHAKLGGFDEDYILQGGEDLDFCQRARAGGAAIEVDAQFRCHRLAVGGSVPGGTLGAAAAALNLARFNELWGAGLVGATAG